MNEHQVIQVAGEISLTILLTKAIGSEIVSLLKKCGCGREGWLMRLLRALIPQPRIVRSASFIQGSQVRLRRGLVSVGNDEESISLFYAVRNEFAAGPAKSPGLGALNLKANLSFCATDITIQRGPDLSL